MGCEMVMWGGKWGVVMGLFYVKHLIFLQGAISALVE
jgi:hypothetical protein